LRHFSDETSFNDGPAAAPFGAKRCCRISFVRAVVEGEHCFSTRAAPRTYI